MPDEPMIPRRVYESERHEWANTVEALHQTIMRLEDRLRQIHDLADWALVVRQVKENLPEGNHAKRI